MVASRPLCQLVSRTTLHFRLGAMLVCGRSNFLVTLFALFLLPSLVYSWSLSHILMVGSHAAYEPYTETALDGLMQGMEECQQQFKYERWNCSQSIYTRTVQNSVPINREVAFVQAISSASIVHAITRQCSTGEVRDCKCSKEHEDPALASREHFTWSGCSDNTQKGIELAINLLDKRRSGRDLGSLIRLHNNKAGRQAVAKTMNRICKCHGVSGSCSVKTCFMKISDLSKVGHYLKRAYRNALQIESNHGHLRQLPDVPKSKLLYHQDSPNYCTLANGTLGRKCSRRRGDDVSSDETNSCRRLCKKCGFKVLRKVQEVSTKCNCQFKFCCNVTCQTCTKKEYTYECAK